MSTIKTVALGTFILLLPLTPSFGDDYGERIEYDSGSGNYIIWYEHEGAIEHTVVIPPIKFNPLISANVELKDGTLAYAYRISNSKTSEMPIETITIDIVSRQLVTTESPLHWKYIEAPDANRGEIIHAGLAYWGAEEVGGIAQGKTIDFIITTNSLPGVGAIMMRGSTPILRFSGEGVGPELEDELNSIVHGDKSYITRYGILPRIPLSFPLYPRDLLEALRMHIQELSDLRLIDTALGSKLSGYLQSAADASLRDNTDGMMRNLGLLESTVMSYNGYKNASSSSDEVIKALQQAMTFNINFIRTHALSMRR